MNTGRDTSRSRLFSEPVWLMIHLVLLGIIILFAGLTAAYLIGPDAGKEAGFRIPRIFWLSSILVLLVSLSMRRVLKAYERDNSSTLSGWLLAATVTALLFVVCQWIGWTGLHQQGITLQDTPAAGYLYVLSGLHVVHVGVGIILLLVSLTKSRRLLQHAATALVYFSDPVRRRRLELLARYWHTIDYLWLFLFLVFLYKHA